MRSAFAPLAFAALVAANPVPQGVTSAITPSSSPPAGCSTSYNGQFEIQVVNVTQSSKRAVEKRQSSGDTTLMITLSGGILHDEKGRTGYVAANNQFQFDDPPQTGAIYTAGFSVCSNGSLAIGGSAMWYQCLSGTFYNLYDDNDAAQCSPVYIEVIGASSTPTPTPYTTTGATTTGPTVVSQQSDGQPTETPVTSAVCEYTDGQPQVTGCPTPVMQTTDGQPQAVTTASPVEQTSDGQPQAVTTVAPVTQISDGQPQAPTSTVTPVCVYSDGQPQASAGCSPSAGNTTISTPTPSATVVPSTGDGSSTRAGLFGLFAGLLAVAML